MPTYDYTCGSCGHQVEVVHGINDHGPRFCPQCGAEGTMKKAFASPAVHFKGSGWAKKDRRATSAPGGTATRAKAGSDAASSEPGAGEASSTDAASSAPAKAAEPAGGD